MTDMIACVACLDPARSIHTATFVRAVELCEAYVCADAPARVVLERFDDAMNAETARCVADQIVARGARAVVGHFASSAADAAAPRYASAGISLFLPAATASRVTRHATTYRVCDSDEDYCAYLSAYCAGQGLEIDVFEHDGSLHGHSVTASIQRLAENRLRADSGRSAILFSGTYANSVAFAAGLPLSDRRPLIFTDDVDAPELAGEPALREREIHIVGLTSRPAGPLAEALRGAWFERFGGDPGSYFWETVAAIQVAIQVVADTSRSTPCSGVWPTVLGNVRFGPDREARPRSFAGRRLLPSGNLVRRSGGLS